MEKPMLFAPNHGITDTQTVNVFLLKEHTRLALVHRLRGHGRDQPPALCHALTCSTSSSSNAAKRVA